MSEFIVSARKYRPVTFESVVGQRHITETLRNAVTRGTIAHAYLFCGPRGVGKTTCARILAKTINCLSPKDNAEPCNECESCRAFADNRSFNIHELDAASNNSVDNIRALTEQVRIPPQVGRYSIYIIDEAHMLSTAAFNAFLKTLEEPPAHAVFILATTEKHKIIPTILSRCQIYDFKRIKVDGVVDYLKFISGNEAVGYDDEALHIIAQKADGCMRDALSMYDKAVLYCAGNLTGHAVAEALNVLDYDTYFNFVDTVAAGDYASALVQFDDVLQKGFDPQIFLGGLCAHLRNLLVAKNGSTMSLLEVTGSVAERYKRQAAAVNVPFVFDALNIVSSGERDIKNSNSQRLQSEIVILKICNLSPVKLTGGPSGAYTLPSGGASAPVAGAASSVGTGSSARGAAPAAPVGSAGAGGASAGVARGGAVASAATVSSAGGAASVPSGGASVRAGMAVTSAPSVTVSARPAVSRPVSGASSAAVASSVADSSYAGGASRGGSKLGLSISSMVGSAARATASNEAKSDEAEPDVISPIAESDHEAVLNACKAYASELIESRPRMAVAFTSAHIDDGRIVLTLKSKIIEQEVTQNKYEFVGRLIELSGVSNISIETVVDETMEDNTKTIFVKDEDKLKYLTEKNPDIRQLCKELGLDFA